VTIKDTDQTTSTEEPELVTQGAPDLVIYPASQPNPTAEVEAEAEADELEAPTDEDESDVEPEAETEAYDDLPPQAETEPDDLQQLESDITTERDLDADEDVETETSVEPERSVDEEIEGETDRQAKFNGDGQADTDDGSAADQEQQPDIAANVESETHDEANQDGPPPATAITGRPFLSDGGVFEERWNTIQISFVDDPRQAVQGADQLVTEAMDDLAKILVSQRKMLQAGWRDSEDVDTEQLRHVLQHYRTFLLGLLDT
jgi:hypothetical protein